MLPNAAHSELGASGMKRWMNCPGSVRQCRGLPDETSPYADEGSAAHLLGEICLRKKKDAKSYVGRRVIKTPDDGFSMLKREADSKAGWEVTEEMAGAVQVYLDAVRSDQAATPNAELLIEQKFDLSVYHPGLFGRNDACVLEPWGKLVVHDYKHGKGVPVSVANNPQMLYYAAGAYLETECDEIELCVSQPRIEGRAPVQRWSISADDLDGWVHDVLIPAAQAAEVPDAPLVPGEWCHSTFCKAMGKNCPAVSELIKDVCKSDLETVPLPTMDQMSDLDLSRVLAAESIATAFFAASRKEALIRAKDGRDIPGHKLVLTKPNRRWSDERAFLASLPLTLQKQFQTVKVLPLTEAEKLVKRLGLQPERVTNFVERPEGVLTLAPLSDKRPAATLTPVAQLFTDLTTIEDDF